ncbi:MAG: 2-amino-4-oxopentanoate thiolase subunit OrtA [Bacillota bacterium]
MPEKGAWVEVYNIVLPAGSRAPQVPRDTQDVPLEMRVRGFLLAEAELGKECTIRTLSGRQVKGILVNDSPRHVHDFGEPVRELLEIGPEVRRMLWPSLWGGSDE